MKFSASGQGPTVEHNNWYTVILAFPSFPKNFNRVPANHTISTAGVHICYFWLGSQLVKSMGIFSYNLGESHEYFSRQCCNNLHPCELSCWQISPAKKTEQKFEELGLLFLYKRVRNTFGTHVHKHYLGSWLNSLTHLAIPLVKIKQFPLVIFNLSVEVSPKVRLSKLFF